MLTVEHPFYGKQVIDIDAYVPPTAKELIYDRVGDKYWLDIPLQGKGVRVKFSVSYLILYRMLNIPKDLFIPGVPTYQFKRFRKLIKSKKVTYVLNKAKEVDTIRTNLKIYEAYNELTKELMILARQYKVEHLNRDIKFLTDGKKKDKRKNTGSNK